MDRPLTHRQIQDLLGAYALDAVDADEAEAVEVHLRECPRCRAEVEEHRETAAMLAHVGTAAPAGVWDRIAEQLEEEAPDFEAGVGAAASRSAASRSSAPRSTASGASASGASAGGTSASTPARPLRARGGARRGADRFGAAGTAESDRTSKLFRVATGALAAAAVLAVVLGVQVVRLNHRIDRMTATVARRGIDQAALAALADPEARRVHLRSNSGAETADAVLLPDGQAYLVSTRLPALSADQTYQLWAVVGGEKISVGVLGASPGVTAFRYSAQPSALAITAEHSGGVVATQKTPVVVGAVPPASA